ncbi:MAG: hypothetical protein N3B13_06355, partial [Deltaproteobacteria bacterium]|nr:hypothetical protein [Deltaproteobacteria bacterium]
MVKRPPKKGDDELEFLDDNSLDEEFIEVDEESSGNDDKTVPRARMPQPVKPIEPLKEIPQVQAPPPPLPKKPAVPAPVVQEEPQRVNPKEM